MDTIVAIVQTPPNHSILQNGYKDHNKVTTMSVMLDALGWEKVFVDLRPFIPTLSIMNPSRNLTTLQTTNNNDTTTTATTTTTCKREIWNDFFQQRSSVSKKEKKTWIVSQEIMSYLCQSQNYHIPLGHFVIIANTRNKIVRAISSGGRPTVEYISAQIINDILSLKEISDDEI